MNAQEFQAVIEKVKVWTKEFDKMSDAAAVWVRLDEQLRETQRLITEANQLLNTTREAYEAMKAGHTREDEQIKQRMKADHDELMRQYAEAGKAAKAAMDHWQGQSEEWQARAGQAEGAARQRIAEAEFRCNTAEAECTKREQKLKRLKEQARQLAAEAED